jgi:hypothetical protein
MMVMPLAGPVARARWARPVTVGTSSPRHPGRDRAAATCAAAQAVRSKPEFRVNHHDT